MWAIRYSPFADSLGQGDETLFKLPAEDGVNTQTAQVIGANRGIEAVAAQVSLRIYLAYLANDRHGHTCAHVHGHIKGN
jgi:hypothetical protein